MEFCSTTIALKTLDFPAPAGPTINVIGSIRRVDWAWLRKLVSCKALIMGFIPRQRLLGTTRNYTGGHFDVNVATG